MKHLKKYQLYTEGRQYEFGCLMLDFEFPDWTSLLAKIDKEDLYKPDEGRYGIEDKPHITVLYGFHDEVVSKTITDKLGELLFMPINITIDGIDIFENQDYDVVKLNVESEELRHLNKLCSELPHTTDYPDYKPHMTLAYVQKGLGSKYKENLKLSFKIKPNFRLSLASGEQIKL